MLKKFIFSLPIQTKITLTLIGAIIISTSIVSYVGHSKAQSIMLERMETSELPNLVQRVRNAIDGETAKMKTITRGIATNPFILNWVNGGLSKDGEETLVRYLKNIQAANGLSNASFANRDTAQYWNQDGFLRVLQNDSVDGWFFAFTNSNQAESASIYAYPNGDVDMFVNFQMIGDKGISGVSKSFNDMVSYLNAFKIEETGFVYLVDKNGLMQIHRDKAKASNQTLREEYSNIKTSTLLQEKDFAFANDGNSVVATSYIPSLDWYVVAEVPTAELYAGLNESRDHMVMWFFIVVLALGFIARYFSKMLMLPILALARVFKNLGDGSGDLSYRIKRYGNDEISDLAQGFNQFLDKIRNVIVNVSNTSLELKEASETVSHGALETKTSAELERDQSIHAATAINQMGITIGDIAKSANVASDATNAAMEKAQVAQTVVGESAQFIDVMAKGMKGVSGTIESLAEKSGNISSVLDVIRGVSEQTNLLALNAAIEAARAGEQGRGFAVVADEVRNLAKRTSESTDEIASMISQLQAESEIAVQGVRENRQLATQGAESAHEANEALKEIALQIDTLSGLNLQVATATEEQLTVVNEINEHVKTVSQNSEKSALNASEMAHSSDELKALAAQLDKMVGTFKID
ncbi:methyl-accepting chemotaxis protein [Psychrosphaera aestuarii]|uniref:methyl-accepting chemotaxis protein n=1 Tax=Psychrosphaera aestuarii TaxID=1266052 RepID=UPI001B327922|nr:methyl-accepting chemotaxis protein [Psychrosphaera aestuarii]